MSVPQQTVDQDVKVAVEAALERLIRAIHAGACSPRVKLLSVKQVAEAAGVSERTVYELVDAGEFPPPVKVGSQNRWRESSLIAWLDKLEGK